MLKFSRLIFLRGGGPHLLERGLLLRHLIERRKALDQLLRSRQEKAESANE